ncbi:RNA-binding region-containing protein 3 [Nylanderia fulva]|uniref:RNA-binding region-containing protein 3 n=1 Tax=Nylanderia fulva TaxID=613905 RepID=UPI0010FB0DC5|nr:RNA-binding region-containing protein 3 [Nylanderia fulva]
MIPTCDTLRILHLPSHLSDDRRDVLLQKYGAIKTKTIRLSEKYTVTYARFSSQQLAAEALIRLHQLNVRRQYLSVQYAKKSVFTEYPEQDINESPANNEAKRAETANKSHVQTFLRKLNNWTINHEFSQPPPPNIKYKYMPPTKNTLIRIAIQLLKVPAFYTQVLHLMNKMNLPPPFEELEVEFPTILKEAYDVEKYKDIFDILHEHTNEDKEEEEESELESDGEDVRPPEIIPVKRKRPQSTKRLKIPKFVNPAKITASSSTQKVIKPEDMFESVQREEIKNLKIELKTLDKSLDEASVNKQDNTIAIDGGFGLMSPINKTTKNAKDNQENAETQKNKFITSEELAANRISINDQRLLPVFKNYHPGKPSNRLYIKNLAKQVETKDLHYIYERYVIAGLKDVENEYDVRLMQEGRMKGQAFITLQNNLQAKMALEETNGYILKDKPMVVQFAKAKS